MEHEDRKWNDHADGEESVAACTKTKEDIQPAKAT